MALERVSDAFPAYTMVWDEQRNAFEGERSYQPEMMACLGTMLVMYKNGALWTNDADTSDSSTWNSFFGTRYPSSITAVFNDNPLVNKTFNSVGYTSKKTWVSNTNGDIKTSFFNTETGFQQISNLKAVDYVVQGNVRVAAFLRDANSGLVAAVAVLEGDYLEGSWLSMKFIYDEEGFANLFAPYINYNLNNRQF
jgi:hypothetical protein